MTRTAKRKTSCPFICRYGRYSGKELGRLRDERAPAGDVEVLVPGAVRAEDGREEAARLVGRLQDDRAGAVAEEDAGRAVGVVDEAGQGVDADDHDPVVQAGLHELRADGQGVDEPGAGGPEIEGPGGAAQLGLDQTGLRDEELIGGAGGDDDEVDVVGGQSRRCPAPAGPR